MSEEIYVNKKGFKCVMSQLAKTDGKDPQEFEKNPVSAKKVTAKYDNVGGMI